MLHNQYQPRTYRNNIASDNLVGFRVVVEETDVFICADSDLSEYAGDIIVSLRSDIKRHISLNPEFKKLLTPISEDNNTSDIIKDMVYASRVCNVGPMAAVAGAIAEFTGRGLLRYSSEIIVENGGDIFLSSKIKRVINVYAGKMSAFKDMLAIEIDCKDTPCGICTSSATVGHSLSFGKADAVVVLSPSASIADACATALCNMTKKDSDIDGVIEYGRSIKGITGILIAVKDKLGIWGNVKLVDI
jgi:uncharacterized protein